MSGALKGGVDPVGDAHIALKLRHELEQKAMTAQIEEANAEAIKALGFDHDTVKILDLIPLLDVAWADGQVTNEECDIIRAVMEKRGLTPNDKAWQLMDSYLESPPSDVFFEAALKLIEKIYNALPGDRKLRAKQDLVYFCLEVADASGGIFGIGRISKEERDELRKIIDRLGMRAERRLSEVLERPAALSEATDE